MTGSFSRGRLLLGLLAVLFVAALATDHRLAAWTPRCHGPILDLVIGIINPIGAGVTLLVTCAVLAGVSRRLRRARLHDAAALAALAFMSAGVVEFGLKHLIGRPRPSAAIAASGLLGPSFAADVDSFPSGHATSVFAVATVFAAFYPRLRWPLYGLAAAIALGRVYLERHYASDIMAGATLGVVAAALLCRKRHALPDGVLLEPARRSA